MNLGYSNAGKNLTGERKVVFSTVDITGKLIIDNNGQNSFQVEALFSMICTLTMYLLIMQVSNTSNSMNTMLS